jgi:hypothetical protein
MVMIPPIMARPVLPKPRVWFQKDQAFLNHGFGESDAGPDVLGVLVEGGVATALDVAAPGGLDPAL